MGSFISLAEQTNYSEEKNPQVKCKMIKSTCLLVIFSVFVIRCTGQWPLGPEFYNNMNRMVNNLNNMTVNLQTMGVRLQREREAKMAEDMRRAKEGIPFGNAGVVFVTAEGGLGYAYNSTDSSYTQYSLGNGSPPRGYMYHAGPFGTSYRSW